MITLHVSSLTTFPLDNGIGVLRDAKYAFAEEELNGILEFEMEYDSHGVLVEELKEERIIKAKASDRLGYQLFRIYKIEKNHDADSITVFAQHITYDLAYYFVEELAVNNVSKNQVMEFISQSTSESHPFTLSSPNTSTMSSTSMYRTNPLQMVGGTQGSVLQIWGGQIERDNFNLTMLDRRGSDSGFKVTYEKNITGLNAEFDLSEVYTRFYPFYIREATDESPQEIITIDGKFIDSDLIGGYGFVRIMPLDYSSDERIDQEDSTEYIKSKMESIVEQYIEDSKPDLPRVSVEVEFAHLWETEEYKDVIVLEEVGMGDTVYVNHTVLDVEASATVNYIKYDCIAEVNEEVKLGRIKDRTSDSLTEVDDIIDRVEEAESKAQSAVISANGKNITYESPDTPTGDIKKGDLWFEVIDGDYRRTWRFDGIEWQLMLDMDSQEAKAEAEDAKDRADDAYNEAQEAVGKAQEGFDKAQEGFDKAQDALEESSSASSKASEALDKAQEGFDKAQDALSSSNIAIGQSAEAFDEARDAFEKAQENATEIDSLALKIKSPNLIPNIAVDGSLYTTSDRWAYAASSSHGTTYGLVSFEVGDGKLRYDGVEVKQDTTYTLSWDIEEDIEFVPGTVMMITDEYNETVSEIFVQLTENTKLGKGEVTITTPNTSRKLIFYAILALEGEHPNVMGTDIRIKLEEGDKATPWTIHDADPYLSHTTITATVDGLETQVTGLDGQVSTVTQIAEGLETRVENNEGSISTLTQTAGSLTSRIEDVENWEIGGRNYLSDSKSFTLNKQINRRLTLYWGVGTYTISFDYEIIEEGAEIKDFILYSYADGVGTFARIPLKKSEHDRVHATFEVTEPMLNADVAIYAGQDSSTSRMNIVKFVEVMVSGGNKATDWTPAPEDTDQKFSAIDQTIDSISTRVQETEDDFSSISQTVEGIQSTVSSVEGDVSSVTQLANTLQNKVRDAEGNISSLTQTSNSLTSRVGAIEDSEIGETNLVLNSNKKVNGTAYRITGYDLTLDWVAGEKWTVVVKGELNEGQRFGIWANGASTNQVYTTDLENGYHRATFTVRKPTESGTNRGPKIMNVYNYPSTTAESATIEWVKLVRAEKTSLSWTPAPEDTDQKFSAIDQTIDSISTRVQTNADNYSSMTQTVDGFQTTVSNMEGDLNIVTNLANANQQSITNVDGKVNTLTQTVDTTVSRIENGDNNLISHNPDYWKYGLLNLSTGGDGGDSKMGIKSRYYIPITGGSWYTLSATSEESDSDLGIEYNVYIHWYNSSNSQLRREIVKHGNSKTMQAPSGASKIKLSLRGLRILGFENEFSLDSLGNVIRVKLQKGKFATEWTEHAGDSYSQYSQLADAINLRVVKGDTITQINLDADKGAYIQGKAIQLDGNVTVHGSFTVGDANIASLNAGKLTAGILDANKVSIVNLNVNSLVGNMSSFVETAWNGISSQVRMTSSGMETFSGGSRTSVLNGSGHNFYRNNLHIGHIGTSSFVGDSNYRGLRFGLENNADYMSWGFAKSASADVYTNMLSWHKTKAKGNKGFTFYDETTFQEEVAFIDPIRTHNSSGYRTLRFVNYDFDGNAGIALLRGRTGGAGLHATTNRVSILAPNSSGNTSSALTVVGGSGGYVSSIEIYNRTYTSNTQLMRVTNNGILGRVSSSRRYKLFEKSINTEYAKRVFEVNAKSWFDKTQAELHANFLTKLENGEECDEDDKAEEELRRIGGVIAEDVHDAGLSMYVNYDDKGRPEGVSHYLWTLLLPIVREHEERLEEQDRKINVLQSMLEELLMKQTIYEER